MKTSINVWALKFWLERDPDGLIQEFEESLVLTAPPLIYTPSRVESQMLEKICNSYDFFERMLERTLALTG